MSCLEAFVSGLFFINLGETWLFCGRRVVADVLRCGGRLLELVDSVRCGACLELLCELYGEGGWQWQSNGYGRGSEWLYIA